MNKTPQKTLVFTILLILALSVIPVSQVQATGPFEQICPKCNGAGTIPHNTTVTCTTCNDDGNFTAPVTCSKCIGTGNVNITIPCGTCGGYGKVNCPVATISTNGFESFGGSTSFVSCEITVNNQADQATYCTAEAIVHITYGVGPNFHPADHTLQSARTLLTPHTDTKITINTPENGIFLTFTYSIYLKSVDQLICPTCQNAGSFPSTIPCDKCNETGSVRVNGVCPGCNGTKTITTLENLPCTECNSTGYVTNWVTTAFVAASLVAVIAVGSVGAFMFHKRKTAKIPPAP
jgi:DnaJ-class molecular chaperone